MPSPPALPALTQPSVHFVGEEPGAPRPALGDHPLKVRRRQRGAGRAAGARARAIRRHAASWADKHLGALPPLPCTAAALASQKHDKNGSVGRLSHDQAHTLVWEVDHHHLGGGPQQAHQRLHVEPRAAALQELGLPAHHLRRGTHHRPRR